MRKDNFLEPDVFFAKPGLSEFHESSAEKNNSLEPEKFVLFAKPGLSEFHKRSVANTCL